MTVGITELPPEGMQLGGVALAGDPERGTKTTEGLSLLFTTAGITVQGPQPQIERLLVWSGLDTASCREKIVLPTGDDAAVMELTSGGQSIRFLLPTENVTPGQAAYLDQALPAWLIRYKGAASSAPPSTPSTPTEPARDTTTTTTASTSSGTDAGGSGPGIARAGSAAGAARAAGMAGTAGMAADTSPTRSGRLRTDPQPPPPSTSTSPTAPGDAGVGVARTVAAPPPPLPPEPVSAPPPPPVSAPPPPPVSAPPPPPPPPPPTTPPTPPPSRSVSPSSAVPPPPGPPPTTPPPPTTGSGDPPFLPPPPSRPPPFSPGPSLPPPPPATGGTWETAVDPLSGEMQLDEPLAAGPGTVIEPPPRKPRRWRRSRPTGDEAVPVPPPGSLAPTQPPAKPPKKPVPLKLSTLPPPPLDPPEGTVGPAPLVWKPPFESSPADVQGNEPEAGGPPATPGPEAPSRRTRGRRRGTKAATAAAAGVVGSTGVAGVFEGTAGVAHPGAPSPAVDDDPATPSPAVDGDPPAPSRRTRGRRRGTKAATAAAAGVVGSTGVAGVFQGTAGVAHPEASSPAVDDDPAAPSPAVDDDPAAPARRTRGRRRGAKAATAAAAGVVGSGGVVGSARAVGSAGVAGVVDGTAGVVHPGAPSPAVNDDAPPLDRPPTPSTLTTPVAAPAAVGAASTESGAGTDEPEADPAAEPGGNAQKPVLADDSELKRKRRRLTVLVVLLIAVVGGIAYVAASGNGTTPSAGPTPPAPSTSAPPPSTPPSVAADNALAASINLRLNDLPATWTLAASDGGVARPPIPPASDLVQANQALATCLGMSYPAVAGLFGGAALPGQTGSATSPTFRSGTDPNIQMYTVTSVLESTSAAQALAVPFANPNFVSCFGAYQSRLVSAAAPGATATHITVVPLTAPAGVSAFGYLTFLTIPNVGNEIIGEGWMVGGRVITKIEPTTDGPNVPSDAFNSAYNAVVARVALAVDK